MLMSLTRRQLGPSPRRRAFRPTIEQLEDRLALSTQPVPSTTGYPYSAAVEMVVDFQGHPITCSGAMIDPTHVLTAAHCLYDPNEGGLADSVTVYAGRNGETVEPFGAANGTHVSVHALYVSGRYAGQSEYDLGIVTIDRPLGNTVGYFGVSPLYPDSFFNNGGTLSILEYPGDTHSGLNQYYATGPALDADVNQVYWLLKDMPIEHGSSGAPVYVTNSDGSRFITAVVSELSPTQGVATRITNSKFNWILSQVDGAASGTPSTPIGPSTVGVFDPSAAAWYLRNSNSTGGPDIRTFVYGAPGWTPVTGDWDGDGTTTIGVVDPKGTWYLRNTNGPGAPDIQPFAYGAGSWTPVVGDWDGDGTTSIGMFDPTTATWYLRNTNGPGAPDFTPFQYGEPGWIPVVGDWDGDGTTTIGVVDPKTMTWYLRNSNSAGAPDYTPFRYGAPGWVPVVGDWDGNGTTTVGVMDPTMETWYLRNSNSAGAPDVQPFPYGAPRWFPLAGAWNGFALPQPATNSPASLALTDAALFAIATASVASPPPGLALASPGAPTGSGSPPQTGELTSRTDNGTPLSAPVQVGPLATLDGWSPALGASGLNESL
jgi:V8-like Glu-specific endopeptidase